MISVEDFTSEAHKFLGSVAERLDPDRKEVWGEGSDVIAHYAARTEAEDRERAAKAQAFMQAQFDAGFGWIRGEKAAGGRDLTADHERAYVLARNEYDIVDLSAYTISLGMVAPTFHHWGSDAVKERYVHDLYRGDLLGCQMFSEPEAGSDVASLKTRAIRDGDGWRVTGQKVWTSVAHLADVALLLARSDPDKPKHKGMVAFALDLTLPGVEVRPLKMITGGTEFNEVFMEDVFIPDDHRLGPVDDGWRVAIFTLMNERALGSGGGGHGNRVLLDRLLLQLQQPGYSTTDPVLRQELAELHSEVEIFRYQSLKADERRNAGLPPGPEESAFKLMSTNLTQKINATAAKVNGMSMVVDTGEWSTYAWSDQLLTTCGGRIAAGTDEIMRNILGERVLGLPKEPGHQK